MSTSEKIVAPAFNATPIVKAWEKYDRATGKATESLTAVVSRTMNAYVDQARASMAVNQESTESLMAAIRAADAFQKAIAVGFLQRKTVTEYAQGAGRAFAHGVEWTPRLKNDPAMALPWSKTAEKTAEKTATETSTDVGGDPSPGGAATAGNPDLTIRGQALCLLKSLRARGHAEAAAGVLDAMLTAYPEFVEK
jgi:hypothetical protein